MIDRFRLWAKGGDGGNGCASFRKSRHDRRGRPDGMFIFYTQYNSMDRDMLLLKSLLEVFILDSGHIFFPSDKLFPSSSGRKKERVEPVIFLLSNYITSEILIFHVNAGGNGGRGGDVILECSPAIWDFSCLQHHVVCYWLLLFVLLRTGLMFNPSCFCIHNISRMPREGDMVDRKI